MAGMFLKITTESLWCHKRNIGDIFQGNLAIVIFGNVANDFA